jgi:hypothetical protein
MHTELIIRFYYGSIVPWIKRLDDGALSVIAGPDRTTAPLRGEGLKTVGDFTVAAGESVAFDLTHSASHVPPPAPVDPRTALDETEAY